MCLKAALHCFTPNGTCTGSFEVKNNIALTIMVCSASRRSVNFNGKDCIIHMPQCLAGMDEHMDNSCKRRAEYLRRSLVIVYTECGRWQVSFIWEKSACLVEVSVTEQILWNFQIPRKPGHVQNSAYQALFSPPMHESLGMRLSAIRR